MKLWVLSLLLGATIAHAGGGIAELSLDRQAVASLVAAALPEPLSLTPAGLGSLTLRLDGPRRVEFKDGEVRLEIRLTVDGLDATLDLAARYVPEVDARTGVFRLVPVAVTSSPRLPFLFDLAGWLGPVDLPRRFEWNIEAAPGRRLTVSCFLQKIEIEADRLRLSLGLATGVKS
jgi:hypothetical protein